jgi:hypothetical protein
LYLLSILYVVYASAFASGGDQEQAGYSTNWEKLSISWIPEVSCLATTLVTSLIRRIMSRRLADTGARACNALINKLVKYPDNRTPLTYAGRAIGTVGTVTSVLHQLKAHCLKVIPKKAFQQYITSLKQHSCRLEEDDATIVSESGIDTDADADDWSPITNEQEATFDPSGYYALTPAKPASAPYTEVDDLEGAEGEIHEPLEEEYATNLGNDTDLTIQTYQTNTVALPIHTDHGVIGVVYNHISGRVPPVDL